MEVKKMRVTNRRQIELLVVKMEENPSVAKGLKFCEATHISKQSYTETWQEISKELNSLGPPVRTVSEWQKVWADYRQNVRKKLAFNKNESQATGGVPNKMVTLSTCEETVVKLLSLDKVVNHPGSVFGLPQEVPMDISDQMPSTSRSLQPSTSSLRQMSISPQQTTLPTLESSDSEEGNAENINIDNRDTVNQTKDKQHRTEQHRKKKKKNEDDEARTEMLKKQTMFMEQIAGETKEASKYVRKIFKLKEEHYKKKKKNT